MLQVSPRAGRSTRSHSGSRTFLGAGRGTSGGKKSGTAAQSATYFNSASMEKQARASIEMVGHLVFIFFFGASGRDVVTDVVCLSSPPPPRCVR